ncbi:MAG: hypothetical protein MZW92_61325 [Comamonadaceae bacterium]|nr:hypothetical protein [Comamonadaceae bacterium]
MVAAQTWLREKSRTKEEIFQGLFPYLQKGWGDLYRGKYENFFGVVEGLSSSDVNALLAKLRQVDLRIKIDGRRPQDAPRGLSGRVLSGEEEEDDYFAGVGLRSAICRLSRDL